jgi:DNA invertase Pin-like site-specific DNA recombinase
MAKMSEQSNKTGNLAESADVRCAAYTRYSSAKQKETSTEDQIRNARKLAAEKDWPILDEYIRSDEELTGRTIVGRSGLADLIRLAQQRPRPFDCILIDDTSRLGRYLPDVLRECDRLMHYGVFVYFVSDRLDTRDEHARIIHLLKGYGDERFIKDHGNRVRRGQEGRVLHGYIHGSKCYGYKNVPVYTENPRTGRQELIGVTQEQIPAQAEVVMRICQMRASEFSFGRIAKTMKAERIAPPANPHKNRAPAWYASTIKQITNNELYRGWRVWNRTQNAFNQAEGRKAVRKRPPSEWIRVEVPKLRIISDELWEGVQAVNRRRHDKYYATRQGGMNRTETSRAYLFSGSMMCGVCGGPYTVVCGKKPNVRYGCPNYRYRDMCTNRMTILRTRLEQQLIAALSANLLDSRLEEERMREFTSRLTAQIELEEKLARETELNSPKLSEERSDLQTQARNLVDAIASHGLSAFLSTQLEAVESRLAEIDRLFAKPEKTLPNFKDEQIRTFLRQECKDFCELLAADPIVAKHEIQKRIKRLVLMPRHTPNGTVLEVTGDVGLFQRADVMLNNVVDEIVQHYTFSISLAGTILDPAMPLAA